MCVISTKISYQVKKALKVMEEHLPCIEEQYLNFFQGEKLYLAFCHKVQYSPGSLHSREDGSGLQVMLVHTALICVLGTNPGLQW